jgi:hypothetical protein
MIYLKMGFILMASQLQLEEEVLVVEQTLQISLLTAVIEGIDFTTF